MTHDKGEKRQFNKSNGLVETSKYISNYTKAEGNRSNNSTISKEKLHN